MRLLSARYLANAMQKDGFFPAIERLLTKGHASADDLVQLLSTRDFANAMQKDGFFPAVERLLAEGYATVDNLVRLLSTPSFAYAVQKGGFFSALATLEQNHGFRKQSEALSHMFSQPGSLALMMRLGGEFFSRIHFLEEIGFSPIQIARCLGSGLNEIFLLVTQPKNSSGEYEARHASNLKWLVTSTADGGPGLDPQDLHRMFFVKSARRKSQKEKLVRTKALDLPIFRAIVRLAMEMHRQYRHRSHTIAGQPQHGRSVETAYHHLAVEFADCVGKTYSLSFSGKKLGLSLRTVTVEKVLNKSLSAAVGKGDRIVAVGSAVVTAAAGAKTIARIIQDAERPLTVTFCRS